MIQQHAPFVKITPLFGDIEEVKEPVLNWKNWNNGSYQESAENNLKAKIGFQPLLVRLHNQLDYSLFNKLNTSAVIKGKQGYFYESGYIEAHYGMDYVGEKQIKNTVSKLNELRDSLLAHNIKLLVFIAPGKASFFPEYIPDEYAPYKSEKTNYLEYKRFLSRTKIPVLDAKQWFEAMKTTSPHPLYPKAGIHWSIYGEFLAVDSLVNRIQGFGFPDMPSYQLKRIQISKENLYGDFDLGNALNLLFKVDTYPLAYPDYEVLHPNGKQPKVLVVGDSYYAGLFYNYHLSEKVFGDGDYWYYNRQIFNSKSNGNLAPKDIDMRSRVEEHDVVVLMMTDGNLAKFGFGWIEAMLYRY